jgi:cytoskeletal protein CcmA (bactofilin family)
MGKKSDEYVLNRVNSVIGKGTVFEGIISTKETLRVDGLVKGTINSEGTLVIGNGGKVEGTINTVNVLVGGEVEGEIFASNNVEANPTGRIFGSIHTKNLIVDEKAIFQGTCEMLEENGEESEWDEVKEQ